MLSGVPLQHHPTFASLCTSIPDAGLLFVLAFTISVDDGVPIKVIGECSPSLDWGAHEPRSVEEVRGHET
jgi:hypothetical protein